MNFMLSYVSSVFLQLMHRRRGKRSRELENKDSKKVWRHKLIELEKHIWLAIWRREQIHHGASEQASSAFLAS